MKGFVWLNFARTRIIIWFLVGFFFGFCLMLMVMHAMATTIIIESGTVAVGDVFSIDIVCIPSQPVKAWEFSIQYSPLLTALTVTKGGFFKNYSQFPILGNISQENHTIRHVYNLVIGQGNVSTTGTLVTVYFLADEPGPAFVTLSGAGVTNETRYLPLTVLNGSLTILPGRSWTDAAQGWLSFKNRYDKKEGWNTFNNTTPTIEGWNRFRNVYTPPVNEGILLVMVVVSISFVIILAFAITSIVERKMRSGRKLR